MYPLVSMLQSYGSKRRCLKRYHQLGSSLYSYSAASLTAFTVRKEQNLFISNVKYGLLLRVAFTRSTLKTIRETYAKRKSNN